jgi:hypothetical protein
MTRRSWGLTCLYRAPREDVRVVLALWPETSPEMKLAKDIDIYFLPLLFLPNLEAPSLIVLYAEPSAGALSK